MTFDGHGRCESGGGVRGVQEGVNLGGPLGRVYLKVGKDGGTLYVSGVDGRPGEKDGHSVRPVLVRPDGARFEAKAGDWLGMGWAIDAGEEHWHVGVDRNGDWSVSTDEPDTRATGPQVGGEYRTETSEPASNEPAALSEAPYRGRERHIEAWALAAAGICVVVTFLVVAVHYFLKPNGPEGEPIGRPEEVAQLAVEPEVAPQAGVVEVEDTVADGLAVEEAEDGVCDGEGCEELLADEAGEGDDAPGAGARVGDGPGTGLYVVPVEIPAAGVAEDKVPAPAYPHLVDIGAENVRELRRAADACKAARLRYAKGGRASEAKSACDGAAEKVTDVLYTFGDDIEDYEAAGVHALLDAASAVAFAKATYGDSDDYGGRDTQRSVWLLGEIAERAQRGDSVDGGRMFDATLQTSLADVEQVAESLEGEWLLGCALQICSEDKQKGRSKHREMCTSLTDMLAFGDDWRVDPDPQRCGGGGGQLIASAGGGEGGRI